MSPQSGTLDAYAIAVGIVAILLTFLPALIAAATQRSALVAAAFLLSLLSLVGLFYAGAAGLGGGVFLPAIGLTWMAALICGLAAYLDAAADRRARETEYRLLHNDARNLPKPAPVKHAEKRERQKPG